MDKCELVTTADVDTVEAALVTPGQCQISQITRGQCSPPPLDQTLRQPARKWNIDNFIWKISRLLNAPQVNKQITERSETT